MNQRIRELAKQANAWFPEGYPSAEGGDEEWKNLVIFSKEELASFVELIAGEIVKDLEVEGCDFSYNESNNYGVISMNFFVDGDPERMRGPEVQQKYRDGIRGSGYYRLNEQFVKHLINRAFGNKE